eukprot:3708343-Rhodomonas_salina.1
MERRYPPVPGWREHRRRGSNDERLCPREQERFLLLARSPHNTECSAERRTRRPGDYATASG